MLFKLLSVISRERRVGRAVKVENFDITAEPRTRAKGKNKKTYFSRGNYDFSSPFLSTCSSRALEASSPQMRAASFFFIAPPYVRGPFFNSLSLSAFIPNCRAHDSSYKIALKLTPLEILPKYFLIASRARILAIIASALF
jgi:hypothetical protein